MRLSRQIKTYFKRHSGAFLQRAAMVQWLGGLACRLAGQVDNFPLSDECIAKVLQGRLVGGIFRSGITHFSHSENFQNWNNFLGLRKIKFEP